MTSSSIFLAGIVFVTFLAPRIGIKHWIWIIIREVYGDQNSMLRNLTKKIFFFGVKKYRSKNLTKSAQNLVMIHAIDFHSFPFKSRSFSYTNHWEIQLFLKKKNFLSEFLFFVFFLSYFFCLLVMFFFSYVFNRWYLFIHKANFYAKYTVRLARRSTFRKPRSCRNGIFLKNSLTVSKPRRDFSS